MKKKVKRIACMILCGLMLWTLAGCAEQPPKVPDTDAASKITYNTNIIAAIQNDGRVVIAGLSMGAGRGQYAAHKWKDIRQIDSSGLHIVGVKKDGTAVACGYNSEGQCDVMDWTNVKQAAAISSETIALFEDGTLGTTNPEHAEEFSAARDITAIACDKLYGNVIALKENGTAEAFITYPPFQSLAREVEKWKDITQVSAGLGYFTGLKEDGTVLFAGGVIESADGTGRGEVKDWTDIAYVAAGDYQTWGIKTDGTVISTEFYDPDQSLGKMPDFAETEEWTDIVALEADSQLVVGLKADGTVVLSGYPEFGMAAAEKWTDIGNWTIQGSDRH